MMFLPYLFCQVIYPIKAFHKKSHRKSHSFYTAHLWSQAKANTAGFKVSKLMLGEKYKHFGYQLSSKCENKQLFLV